VLAFGARDAAAQTGAITVTLTASDYNGYNISCFGVKDGAIDATVSGGTAPYTYAWSNNATTEDLSGLATGYYRLVVTDAASATEEAEITLTEPLALRVGVDPFTYPSGMNVSCNECFNGSIDITVADGVPPYSYQWDDGPTTADRSGLGALAYQVIATDANGCTIASGRISLTQPERDDWSKQGNAGTNPNQHYFGTSDAKDVVFKSNGTERIRLLSDGAVRLPSMNGSIPGLLVADSDGTLKRFEESDFPEVPIGCPAHDRLPWLRCGNVVSHEEYLGTNNARPLLIKTDAELRMIVTNTGKVGIGVAGPTDQFEVLHTDQSGGMRLINGSSGNAHSEIRFFQGSNQRWGLGCDIQSNGGQDFFLWDHQANSTRLLVNSQGRVGIGTEPPTGTSAYRLFVEDGVVTRDVRVTQAANWPDFVFDASHHLMPLRELREYLNTERHMPGMPSAKQLEQEGGYDVGDMQARLLKLVEEQALYILQLEERLSALERTGQAAKP
jgi:hypothetical protein